MRIAAEPGVEPSHLLVHHSVLDDAVFKRLVLLGSRQLAVEKEITCFKKGALLSELFDRITAIECYPLSKSMNVIFDSQLAVEVKPGS